MDDWVPSTPQNIKPCPEAKNGVHRWIWHAACRLAATGVPPAEAEAYIMARLTRQPDPPNEVTASIAKAYRLQTELPKNTKWNGIPFEKPEFCPNKLKRIAASMDGVDANWLARRSSVRVDNRTPASFLHALFHKGEHVLVFDKFRSQGQALWTHPGLPYDARTLNQFRDGATEGVWFLSNPCDGKFHDVPRLADEQYNPLGTSRRAEESLTDYRHLLVESDEVDPTLWLAALVQLPLPILSIVTSGGRSIHALVRTGCHTKAEWEDLVNKRLKPQLIRLGACQSSTSAVRLTRLPCCRRECKNALQQLLYLNPNPEPRPICEMPEFIPKAILRPPGIARTRTPPPYGSQ